MPVGSLESLRVIGLISGTSVDGIDAALVEVAPNWQIKLLAGETFAYPPALRQQILEVCDGAALTLVDLAALDDAIAAEFARAARRLGPADLIGSHGQTVYHRPATAQSLGYSLQLGRGEVIARQTGLPTVSNFRAADIAAGGQGAPLVPLVDWLLLTHPQKRRCVQNLGGIGNVTWLDAGAAAADVRGWDTGPANVLLDLAVQQLSGGKLTYDADGQWAAQGTPDLARVQAWLEADYFHIPPPKSTGRELFGLAYVEQCQDLSAADTLATLTEFTARSIVHSYQSFLPTLPDEVLLCGGGSRNPTLRARLQALLAPVPILTTDAVGLPSDFKEAIAFAVLACRHMRGEPGNLPQVTGANRPVILGQVHGIEGAGVEGAGVEGAEIEGAADT
ncbi:anhydro-N-acetylmuramic acid kinase [Leptolyngbya sp. FACHB-261]|uniref:anhydro-N-acetylmuramic acid kinase n=1 Tax=Leptolyngbya sp. FACHB-261 TaxID=2692806 RepID=UPI00168289DA|nr:anhydro-N-acetylmuramic acid kinase [Leptolyngbya sp. FACHB-261]MBD2099885.1 anhydro-N-acetylmuramic acid kinase [Leptolyngbya sp. FACHB-261]